MNQQYDNRHAARVEARLPGPVRSFLHAMRRPAMRWVRIPAGVILVIGGFLGFLPILGFWMIPLGLLLLAEDYPPLYRQIRRGMIAIERLWRRARRRWGGRIGG